jgi:hypothetical protein
MIQQVAQGYLFVVHPELLTTLLVCTQGIQTLICQPCKTQLGQQCHCALIAQHPPKPNINHSGFIYYWGLSTIGEK